MGDRPELQDEDNSLLDLSDEPGRKLRQFVQDAPKFVVHAESVCEIESDAMAKMEAEHRERMQAMAEAHAAKMANMARHVKHAESDGLPDWMSVCVAVATAAVRLVLRGGA